MMREIREKITDETQKNTTLEELKKYIADKMETITLNIFWKIDSKRITKMKTIVALLLSFVSAMTFGQQLTDFKLVNVVNDQPVSSDTYPSCSGLVVIFTSNMCPYDEYYRARIAKLASSYTDKVPVLLVNSQPDPAESKENMSKKAKQANWSIPYLEDKNQTLMTALDAKKTAEAFLLKNEGGKFTVVYRGAIDDNAQVEADVRHHYLRDAIDIMLANQKIETAEVRPVGCTLKKK